MIISVLVPLSLLICVSSDEEISVAPHTVRRRKEGKVTQKAPVSHKRHHSGAQTNFEVHFREVPDQRCVRRSEEETTDHISRPSF